MDRSNNTPPALTYLSESVIFSRQQTIFVHQAKGIRKTIVDSEGNILSFPGIANPEVVVQMLDTYRNHIPSYVQYRTEFHLQEDGRHLMIWEIQPDGRYWADEGGFGMENDDEVRLYTYLDEQGDFTGPFRIYDIGNTKFFGTGKEELLARERADRVASPFEAYMDRILPTLLNRFLAVIQSAHPVTGRFPNREVHVTLPGLDLDGVFSLIRTGRGASLEFFIPRDEKKDPGLTQTFCRLEHCPLYQLKIFFQAEKTMETIKSRVWHHAVNLGKEQEGI